MTKFYRGLIVFISIHTFFLIASCNEEVECGGYADKFGIIGFSVNEYKYLDEGNLFLTNDIAANDTISYDSLYLHLSANIQTFGQLNKGSFMNTCYACSPLIPYPVDTVASIRIFEKEQTGLLTFDIGKELSDDFDVVFFTEEYGFSARISLKEFNSVERPASSSYFLFPNKKPDELKRLSFEMVVT
ncbi:MAG: hypothetical protein WBA74_16680, partial [Cyclobacteriaceae bacterium]